MARGQKKMTPAELMVDYTNQLERYREGRTAIHVRLSKLERQYQASYYRQKVAYSLKNIVDKFSDSHMYALPNSDVVLIANGASSDDIEPALYQVRKDLKDSSLIASLDPVSGVSDGFVSWYPLERDYKPFKDLVHALAASTAEPGQVAPVSPQSSQLSPSSQSANVGSGAARVAVSRTVREVPIQRTDANLPASKKPLDPTLLRQLTDALKTADVSAFIRRQNVMVMLKKGQGHPVFSCRFVPLSVVAKGLLPTIDLSANHWLRGYLQEYLADRMIKAKPQLGGAGALAASFQTSVSTVLSPAFDDFDEGLGSVARGGIVAEISMLDMIDDGQRFEDAREKLKARGFKICLRDVELFTFIKMQPATLNFDFLKIKCRDSVALKNIKVPERRRIIEMIEKIGRERVIMSGVSDDAALREAMSLTISLFQGDAVAPVTN